MVQSTISRSQLIISLGRVSIQGMAFLCKEMLSMEIRVIQLTGLHRDFKMVCGNALKHLKNTQKLLKKLSCHGIRDRALLGLVTGARSGSKEQEQAPLKGRFAASYLKRPGHSTVTAQPCRMATKGSATNRLRQKW